ncbi:hypothetical protein B0H14DRAFT_2723164 [Mycena olivaceomarginata]|nr:hypothetical protein B0H14DRAFT_2723164 [Mycena olivaceomarginata]
MQFDSRRTRKLSLLVRVRNFPEPWMTQANHIFTQIHSTSHLEDYVCVTEIAFTLRSLPNTYNTQEPEGYLFVCPPENFRTGRDSFHTHDAQSLGFPIIHIETIAYGSSWDNRVYDGLRRFHRDRGFDPEDTQEAAIHCGYPLYKVLSRPIGLW